MASTFSRDHYLLYSTRKWATGRIDFRVLKSLRWGHARQAVPNGKQTLRGPISSQLRQFLPTGKRLRACAVGVDTTLRKDSSSPYPWAAMLAGNGIRPRGPPRFAAFHIFLVSSAAGGCGCPVYVIAPQAHAPRPASREFLGAESPRRAARVAAAGNIPFGSV